MDIVRAQMGKALKSLPWYLGVPLVVVAPLAGLAALLMPDVRQGCWDAVRGALIVGFVFWVVRQSVRLLWTARVVSKTTAVQIIPPR